MKKVLKIIFIILILLIVGFGSYFLSKKITENYIQNNLVVEDITLEDFINKFNKNLKSENIDESIELGDVIALNKTYWLKLNDNIDIALMVDKVESNKEKAILRISALSYNSDLEENKDYEKYLKILIKTNNEKLSNDEIKKIIKNSSDMSDSKKENGLTTSNVFDYKGLGVDKTISEELNTYRIARYK